MDAESTLFQSSRILDRKKNKQMYEYNKLGTFLILFFYEIHIFSPRKLAIHISYLLTSFSTVKDRNHSPSITINQSQVSYSKQYSAVLHTHTHV